MISQLYQDYLSSDYNTEELDNRPCKWCGEIPPTFVQQRKHSQRTYIDRSSRIDCDASTGDDYKKLETYHKECWIEACKEYV